MFFCLGDYEDEAVAVEQGTWRYAGNYWSETNGGQRSARQQAIQDDTEAGQLLTSAIVDGEPVFMFCIPNRSMHPHKVIAEQQEPKVLY